MADRQKEEKFMGLFGFGKSGQGGRKAAHPLDLASLYLTNDSQTLARLRHAILGDWNFSFEIRQTPEPAGTFRTVRMSETVYHATLRKCDCGDSDEAGKPIRPCQHMYRLALETGRFEEMVASPEIEALVRGMRDPLFNTFRNIVFGGFYESARKWTGSKKTHDELTSMGLICDVGDQWRFTDYFLQNAAALNYYVCIDSRGRRDAESVFRPDHKRLSYTPSKYQVELDRSLPDPFLSTNAHTLKNLRSAIIGYGCGNIKVKRGFLPSAEILSGTKKIKASLSGCSCADSVRPCVHMYRLALETGKIASLSDPKIKKLIDELSDSAYKGLEDLVRSAFYDSTERKWEGAGFTELKNAGVVQGEKDSFSLTSFFRENVISFTYYTYTDRRDVLRYNNGGFYV